MQANRNLAGYALTYISAAIMSYLDFTNRKELMNEQQIAETAMLILEEPSFQSLKLDDLVLFIRKCKMGDFGELYTLNGSTIILWLKEYVEKRSMAFYNMQQQEEQERREKEWAENDVNDPKIVEAREHCMKKFAEYQNAVADKFDAQKQELTTKQKVEKLRLRIIRENASLLRTDPDHAFEKTEQKIYEALVKAGLPTDSCNIKNEKQ